MKDFLNKQLKSLKSADNFNDLAVILADYNDNKNNKTKNAEEMKKLTDKFGNDFKSAKVYAIKELLNRIQQYNSLGYFIFEYHKLYLYKNYGIKKWKNQNWNN